MTASGKEIVRKYYEEFWNRWDFELGSSLIAKNAIFWGAKAVTARGRGQFFRYVQGVRRGFPDLRHRIEELSEENGQIKAAVAVTGTHRGALFGVKPTGRRVQYRLEARFRFSGGQIAECWTAADAAEVSRQLRGEGSGAMSAASGGGFWSALRKLWRLAAEILGI